jgi:hypothetical protein
MWGNEIKLAKQSLLLTIHSLPFESDFNNYQFVSIFKESNQILFNSMNYLAFKHEIMQKKLKQV